MKYKCAIFDLDGTLLDSLQGILDAVNLSFKQLGYKVQRTYEEGKYFIGAGAIEFARRAMKGQKIPVEKEREVMESFLMNYEKIQKVATKKKSYTEEDIKTFFDMSSESGIIEEGYTIPIEFEINPIIIFVITKPIFTKTPIKLVFKIIKLIGYIFFT